MISNNNTENMKPSAIVCVLHTKACFVSQCVSNDLIVSTYWIFSVQVFASLVFIWCNNVYNGVVCLQMADNIKLAPDYMCITSRLHNNTPIYKPFSQDSNHFFFFSPPKELLSSTLKTIFQNFSVMYAVG